MKRVFLCLTTILLATQMWGVTTYYLAAYVATGCSGMGKVGTSNSSITQTTSAETSTTMNSNNLNVYAQPNADYEFVGWFKTEDGSGTALTTVSSYGPTVYAPTSTRAYAQYTIKASNMGSSYCYVADSKNKKYRVYAKFRAKATTPAAVSGSRSSKAAETISEQSETVSRDGSGAGVIKNYALPSDVVDMGGAGYWRTMNVGAGAATIAGYYYQWGTTKANGSVYSTEANYTCPSSADLVSSIDAATVACGQGYCVPKPAEWTNLFSSTYCTVTPTTTELTITSKTTGNSIVLPIKTGLYNNSIQGNSAAGCYWTDKCNSCDPYTFQYYYPPANNQSGSLRTSLDKVSNSSNVAGTQKASTSMYIRPIYNMTGTLYTLTVNVGSYVYKYKGASGQAVRVRAAGDTGYSAKWQDTNADATSYRSFTLNSDITVTVVYSQEVSVSVSASPSAGGNPTASSVSNGNCTLTANPANGYQFVNWTEGNSVLSTAETYNMTGVNSARTVVANYVLARTVHQNNALNTDIFAMNEGGTELAGPTSNYVDLGLSVYWATKNIGANSIGEAGTHVAWGEVASKASYTANTYSISGLSALNSASNDLAMAQWGNGWRTPTTMEFQELIEGCDWTWEVQDHQWGYTVSSKTNSNSIFLPASGYLYNNVEMLAGTWGYYWANSVSNLKGNANCLKIAHPSGEDLYQVSNDVAHNGDVVRAVYPKPAKTYTLTIGTNQGTNVNTYTGTYGQTIRIKVVCESENHHFAGWSDGNTDALRTFTISGDARYDAIFEQNVSGTEVTNDAGMEAVESGSAVTVSGDVSVTATVQDLDMVRVTNKSGLTIGDGHALVINDLTIDKGSSITIESGGSVIVNGTLNDQNEDGSGIIVKADENDMGTLAIEHDGEFELIQPYGSVELYTMAGLIGGSYKWQHFGIPTVEKPVITKSASYTTWYYKWDLQEGWINGGSKSLEPWKGFNLTNKSPEGGVTYTFTGQLVGNAPMAFSCDQKGWYVIANSYTKPIYLKTLMEALSAQMDVDAQVQLYEPVYHENSLNLATITMDDIDENSQNYQKYNRVLPMQAFFIRYMSNINGDFQLPYVDATQVPEELNQVAARRAPAASVNKVVITMTDNLGGGDQLTLREKPSYTIGYDSGSDATKILAMVPNIYVTTTEGAQGSFAVPALIGSYIDIKTSEATQYTLTFSEQMGTEYAIKDTQTGAITNMNAESSYVFQAEPNKVIPNRFVVVERRNTPTALDEEEAVYEAGVRKVVEDGTVYILKNGIRYNLLGAKANK